MIWAVTDAVCTPSTRSVNRPSSEQRWLSGLRRGSEDAHRQCGGRAAWHFQGSLLTLWSGSLTKRQSGGACPTVKRKTGFESDCKDNVATRNEATRHAAMMQCRLTSITDPPHHRKTASPTQHRAGSCVLRVAGIAHKVERSTIEVAGDVAHQRYADLSQTIGARWTPPPVLTDHRAEGMRALADLRARWATRTARWTPTVGERTVSDSWLGALRWA